LNSFSSYVLISQIITFRVAAPHFCEVLSAPLQVLRNLFEELDVDPPEKIFLVAKEKKETVIFLLLKFTPD